MFIKDQFLSPIFDKSPNISKRYGKSHEKKTLNGVNDNERYYER